MARKNAGLHCQIAKMCIRDSNELVGNNPLKAVEFIDLAAEHVLEKLHHII